LPVKTWPTPKTAAPTANAVWKGSRLLVPAGGVSMIPEMALDPKRILSDKDGTLALRYKQVGRSRKTETWWWD